jgi:hypothetical protein
VSAPPCTRLLTLLCAALPLACGEPLSPSKIAGAYALQRVAGDSLPALLYTNENVTVRVFAETLSFTPDGRGTVITVRESQPLIGGPSTGPTRGEIAFGFQVVEGRIQIAFDCPPNANCAAPPHVLARWTGNGLQALYALGARIPQVYTHVAPRP